MPLWLTLAGYVSDAAVMLSYLVLALSSTRQHARAFHWVNALAAPPVIAGEVLLGAYVPLVLTTFFGVAGWVGVWRTR